MYPWEISYIDLTNTDSLKIPPTVTGQDGKWRHWKRYASDVNWCWCWCCWRCRRPGGSFKMFQVTVSHLWIDAEVLQMPGGWSQYCSHPFEHAFQLEPLASFHIYVCVCAGEACRPFPPSLPHPPHHHHRRLLLWVQNVIFLILIHLNPWNMIWSKFQYVGGQVCSWQTRDLCNLDWRGWKDQPIADFNKSYTRWRRILTGCRRTLGMASRGMRCVSKSKNVFPVVVL